ncbi:NAD(P)-binding protein [Thozetella sp. PMI_491]|nr:NAD(P)-binding protein [Thozetella sp. PMI_491]
MMSTGADQVAITVLGAAGLIGKRHVDHIIRSPLTRLHSIVDPTPEGAQLAAKLGVPAFTSLEELVKSFTESKPHGAVIATPTHLHVSQALELIKHNIHLLIEKPVSVDVKTGRQLLQAAAASGTASIIAGYHKRFNPYNQALKAAVDSGDLGRIVAVQGVWAGRKPDAYFTQGAWRTKKGSGGPIMINMSHEIDIFRYIFGEITRVFHEPGPKLRGYEVEETGAVTLRFASGAVGTFVFSDTALTPFTFEAATGENPELIHWSGCDVYRVMGTKGSIELPSLKRYYYSGEKQDGCWTDELAKDDLYTPTRDPGRFQYTYDNAPFTKRLVHWVDVIQKGATPNCTLKDGIMATKILDALVESAEKGKVPIVIMGGVPSKADPSKTLQVIGAGYSRTGTVSMQIALEKLLDGPVCHGATHVLSREAEYLKKWIHAWRARRAGDKETTLEIVKELSTGYVGCTDIPNIIFTREMLELYPDAKVVLVKRDPLKWWKSFKPVLANADAWFLPYLSLLNKDLKWFPPMIQEWKKDCDDMCRASGRKPGDYGPSNT